MAIEANGEIMRYAVIFVMVCSLCFSLPANSAAAEHDSLVARVVELDGLDRAFDAIPEVFDSIAATRQLVSRNVPDEQRLHNEVMTAIDLNAARRTVAEQLTSRADDETLTSVLAWLESPLGRKIAREEINAATERDPTAMQRYLTGLRFAPLPRERVELMHRFVTQKKMAEVLAKITRDVTNALLTGLDEGEGCTVGDPAAVETVREHDEALLERMWQQSILRAIFAYRNITDDEMEQYLRFMTSEPYLRYDGIIRDAIDRGMSDLFRAIGKKMAQVHAEIRPGEPCGCPDREQHPAPQ